LNVPEVRARAWQLTRWRPFTRRQAQDASAARNGIVDLLVNSLFATFVASVTVAWWMLLVWGATWFILY
jgi:hypothetical protein